MEKREIVQRALSMQSKEDLLQLLNDIVKDELSDEHAFSFSMKQLSYYSNPNNVRGRYHHFSIPKKSGGMRNISAPSKGLSHILYYVNMMLKAIYQPSDYAMGFVEGRNVVDNASKHLGQNYIFNTDLENFFPSIVQPRVWKRFQLPPFNFNQQIASVLAGLCCVREKLEDGKYIYVLPQGAPTSPLITNAICDKLDRRLSGLARRFGLHYSRYADDITFSSMHHVYQDDGEFKNELKHIIETQGFRMNIGKTRLQKLGQRQEVTGLTVSNRVNTSREYVAEIRNLLHIWEKYGYNDAFKSFYSQYKTKKGHVKKVEPMLENVLYGKLQYLKMVKGYKDPVYSALQARYDKLTSPIYAHPEQEFDFLHSYQLADFEKIVGGQISYALSKAGNIYGKVYFDGKPIVISISKEAKQHLAKHIVIEDENVSESVTPCQKPFPAEVKTGLFVVLTAKNGKERFWMMTANDPTKSDVNSSNISVRELIAIWEKAGIDAAIDTYMEGVKKSDTESHDDKSPWEDINVLFPDKPEDDISCPLLEDIEAIQEEINSGKIETIMTF